MNIGSRRLMALSGAAVLLVAVVAVSATFWASSSTPCHTAFVLEQPVEVSVALNAIEDSEAVPVTVWLKSAQGTSGGVYGEDLSIQEITGEIEATESRFGHTRITAFRLKGIVGVESLGSLASSIQYQLVVHQSAVVTAPDLKGDPPIHIVKAFGSC
ncbi:MAG TPA: hypothetical protein VGR49_01980 [Actinomycetota bacterium]|nr:hypothetical protein [Actinomycetota bacterium]